MSLWGHRNCYLVLNFGCSEFKRGNVHFGCFESSPNETNCLRSKTSLQRRFSIDQAHWFLLTGTRGEGHTRLEPSCMPSLCHYNFALIYIMSCCTPKGPLQLFSFCLYFMVVPSCSSTLCITRRHV